MNTFIFYQKFFFLQDLQKAFLFSCDGKYGKLRTWKTSVFEHFSGIDSHRFSEWSSTETCFYSANVGKHLS